MGNKGAFTILVEKHDSGKRLDIVIASRLSDCSRSLAATLIREGEILVQRTSSKPGYRVKTGDEIYGHIPHSEPVLFKPEPIQINILYEDECFIVVNKQPGLVVHPGAGHYTGTLVNGLLYHCKGLEGVGDKLRPGIVHRLDKDTSGALVVAKNDVAYHNLSQQFKSRKIKKEYLALVYGEMESESGTVSLPVGRHPVHRKKMSTVSRKGRVAETSWQTEERFHGATLLKVNLKTGRTHQIRVHCAAINHPVIGDSLYGGRKTIARLFKGQDVSNCIKTLPRQMLHAWRLQFTHPVTEKNMSFEASIPRDMTELIDALREKSQ